MIDLIHKPVNSRKARPSWALNDRLLMLKCVGKHSTNRFQIAQMYWQKNMTASDIAIALDMRVNAVELVLFRLFRSK